MLLIIRIEFESTPPPLSPLLSCHALDSANSLALSLTHSDPSGSISPMIHHYHHDDVFFFFISLLLLLFYYYYYYYCYRQTIGFFEINTQFALY